MTTGNTVTRVNFLLTTFANYSINVFTFKPIFHILQNDAIKNRN
jgi:hypothetical protein